VADGITFCPRFACEDIHILIMKKYFSLIALIAVTGIFHSCKKDKQATAPAKEPAANALISAAFPPQKLPLVVSFETDHGTTTMLKFTSWQDFDALANHLQGRVDAYEQQFNDDHSGLSDDELNEAAEGAGFDKQQPLIDLEKQFNFNNAYRKLQNQLKEEWLSHEDLDMSKNPSMKTMFYGAEQSLINDKQQVMVDNTIYQCTEKGYYFIKSDYAGNLSLIESGAFGSFEQPSQTMGFFDWLGNVLTGTSTNPSSGIDDVGCTTWKKVGQNDNRVPSKKLYYYTGIRSIAIYCKSLAGVESYYKKGNKWKGYKTRITVFLTAALRDLYCGDVGPNVTEWEEKKSDDLQAHETSWGGGEGNTAFRAKNGLSIYGNYTYYGLNQAAVLSW
jgi:hypothetical protein